ncbi:hypothetical protein [Streptomyces sp. DSM 40484]|uniref:hypothetical protein n=1 Tax=Streptomyces kroppenstedtii TaxID=3051181 RepID=UPI0028D2F7A8|nr:hypothetical protein [Streptomyces sp. DSM 40484]
MPSMNFLLTGQDGLSRVFDSAGDSARRMARRLHAASGDADRNIRTFARNSSTHLAGLQRDTDAGGKAIEELGKVTKLLAPAALPAAASLVPIAAGAGTVAVAALAMTAAIVPQIGALSEAAEKEKAYEEAVAKGGARSKEAVAAHTAYVESVSKLPPETRRAAAALGILKDTTKEWSDSLAGVTMAPVTKGIGILNALLPKTSGLVKVTAAETDRFMTIIGGGMEAPGLDRLNSKFTNFAQKTLRGLNDQLIHLLRVGDSGEVGGKAAEFMEWARAQGPTVASVLNSVGEALIHILDGASGVGVSLLQIIDVAAGLVSAVPPGAIAMFLQLALAMKLTKAAALGFGAARTGLAMFGAQLLTMNSAAAATPGRMAAARASIMALSRTAKLAVAGTGVGLLVIALGELSQRGKSAPPDVDRLTSSLRELGSTGKVTGEAAKHFGSDLDGLYGKVRSLTDPSTTDKVQQFLVGWSGWDSTPVKDAKENIGAVDEALANLVKDGQGDLAAAALKRLTAEYGKGGKDTSEFTGKLKDYKSALADAKFEQDLAAQSMGLFGAQAQSVQAKLAEQKKSADGLRQSLQALNDVQRAGLGGMIGFESAIDSAAKAAKDNAGALDMSGGKLNLNSEKARTAATALNDLAARTDEATASARESGASWESVNGIYDRGRSALIKSATQMGLTRKEAAALADQILKTPNKTARLKGNLDDLKAKVGQASKDIKSLPSSKRTEMRGKLDDLQAKLAEAKRQIKSVPPSKRSELRATINDLQRKVASARAALSTIQSKTITVTTFLQYKGKSIAAVSAGRLASGGRVKGYAGGGSIQGFPDGGYVDGPGTPTSDSILALMGSGAVARVANTEFVMRGAAVRKYGVAFMEAVNSLRLPLPGLAAGGPLAGGGGGGGAGAAAAQGLVSGMTGSTALVEAAARKMAAGIETGIRDELEIASPSKKTKALANDVGKGLIVGMTGSRDKIKATSKDLAKDIWSAFSGSKDNRLVAYVNKHTKTLLSLAGKRDALEAKIKKAKEFAESTRVNAKQSASLGGMFEGEEQVTAAGINSKLQQRLAKMKMFSSYVATLAKRGLNKTMLREILEMGPEQGYAYASALAGSHGKMLKEINSTQYKVNAQAEKLGKSGADALYDSGKNAGKGFLKGLAGQQEAIEKQMVKIAKAMQKALRKALGIKSPATKMMPDGENTARGIGVGVIKGIPFVERAMDSVAASMTGRVGKAPVLGRAAVAGAGGGTFINVQVDVHEAMDPVAVGRELQRVLVQFGRVQGATVVLSPGR